MNKLWIGLVGLGALATGIQASAQQVYYSQPEKADSRSTAFEIIGKVGNHILVYKGNRGDYAISIYDDHMNPVNRVPLKFQDNLLNVDFVSYPDKCLMIFQFQHRRYVYCYGMELDQNAQAIHPPVLIDSTDVGLVTIRHRLYSMVHSEDHDQLLVYKINQSRNRTNVFYTFLLDDNLDLINNSKLDLPMESRRDYLSNFSLGDDGSFLFDKVEKATSRDLISKGWMVEKPLAQDTFYLAPFSFRGQFIDEVKLKLDNARRIAYGASFYYNDRRGNITGIYSFRFDFRDHKMNAQHFASFDKTLQEGARNGTARDNAFDNYFLRQIIVRSDGGFLVTAEEFVTNSQNAPWNRWDYLYGPYSVSPYYYSNFASPWYYNPYYNNYGNYQRFHYNDIAILSYNAAGNLEWSNFLRKQQYYDENDDYLSYQLVNIGSELHFIYNENNRSYFILKDAGLDPAGKLDQLPVYPNLDNGYQWMPRYGKQVSVNETVIPCIYRNFMCFAKISF